MSLKTGAQNLSTTFIQLQLVELETQCSEWIVSLLTELME